MTASDLVRRVSALLVLIVAVMCGPTVFAQATETLTGVAPQAVPTNEWGVALVWAFFSSSALEWLKRNPTLTLISERTSFVAQRALGMVLAVAAAVGVAWSFDSTAGVLTVTGLQVASIWTLGGEVIRQWVIQEITYRTTIRNYRAGEANAIRG